MKKVGNFHQLWDHSEEHMIIPNELLYFLGINRARRMFFLGINRARRMFFLVVYFTSENGIAGMEIRAESNFYKKQVVPFKEFTDCIAARPKQE